MPTVAKRLASAASAALRAFRGDNTPGAAGLTNPREPVKPLVSQGRSATPAYGGFVVTRETNQKLIGSRRYTTYDEMLCNTSIVAASTRYYQNMIARPGWEFEAVDDTPEARKYAELLDEAIRGHLLTSWSAVIKRAATYRLYGFSTQEWIARKVESGMIAFVDIQSRMQRTVTKWDVSETGTVHGLIQQSPHDGREYYIPRGKLLYMVDNAFDDSPEGLGLFRQAVTAHQALVRFAQLEGWGFENDLRGTPVARVPLAYLQREVDEGRMDPEKMEEIVAPFRDIIENHVRTPQLGLLLDSMVYASEGDNIVPTNNKMFDFSVLTGEVTAKAQDAVANAIKRLNWDIARIFGTETLLLGADGRGAYALSQDKTQNLLMVVDGVLLDIGAQVVTDFITTLFHLNGWPMKYRPRPVTDAIAYRDVETITKSLLDMAKAGAVLSPDDPVINVIRGAMGVPKAPEVNRAAEALIANNEAAAAANQAKAAGTVSGDQKSGKVGPKNAGSGDQQSQPGIGD